MNVDELFEFARKYAEAAIAAADRPDAPDTLTICMQAVLSGWNIQRLGKADCELSPDEFVKWAHELQIAFGAAIMNLVEMTQFDVPPAARVEVAARYWLEHIGANVLLYARDRVKGLAPLPVAMGVVDNVPTAKAFDFRQHLKGAKP